MSHVFHRVAARDELVEGEGRHVDIGKRQIGVYLIEGEVYAIDNVCTHAYALLSDGFVDGDEIECPLHGGTFDIRTGKARAAPCSIDLETYPVRIEDGAVLIGVPE